MKDTLFAVIDKPQRRQDLLPSTSAIGFSFQFGAYRNVWFQAINLRRSLALHDHKHSITDRHQSGSTRPKTVFDTSSLCADSGRSRLNYQVDTMDRQNAAFCRHRHLRPYSRGLPLCSQSSQLPLWRFFSRRACTKRLALLRRPFLVGAMLMTRHWLSFRTRGETLGCRTRSNRKALHRALSSKNSCRAPACSQIRHRDDSAQPRGRRCYRA